MQLRRKTNFSGTSSRRDFIRGAATSLAALGLGAAFSSRARASVAAKAAPIPVLVFDLAGGAALPGNFLVGGKNGPYDLLPSYDALGWNPRSPGALDTCFGLPMARDASRILAGLRSVASDNTLGLVRISSFCHYAMDDTTENPLSILPLVGKAGNVANPFVNGISNYSSQSGGHSSAVLAPHDWPTYLSSLADVDGYGLDPRTSEDCCRIYQLADATPADDRDAVDAAVVYNVLRRTAGVGALVLEGCDYHDGTQSSGDSKDFEIGLAIGRAIELAAALSMPLFFQIITDGGCFTRPGTRSWTGDDGLRSMSLIGLFHPRQAPAQTRLQVGFYGSSQQVDLSTLIGNNPAKASYAAFVNYLNILGRLDEVATWIPGVFTPAEVESVLAFDVQNL